MPRPRKYRNAATRTCGTHVAHDVGATQGLGRRWRAQVACQEGNSTRYFWVLDSVRGVILTICECRYEKLVGYLFDFEFRWCISRACPKEEAVILGSDGQLEGDALRASSALWILVMWQW